MNVPFLDLRRQTASQRDALDAAIGRVLASGRFVLTEEVEEFERAFAAYCGARFAIGVASGTDAITIALLAAGVEPGDEVVTAPNTCIPTIVGIERAGARPVLADVDPVTYTLDAEDVARVITSRTRAILPVHLYGQMADMGPLLELAADRDVAVVEDCAQAHGATWQGRQAGSLGAAAAFSFYPTKNLGALGDGGAVTTDDPAIADRARLLRNYGERERFEHVLRGLNSRLDALQAAVLSTRLPMLDAALERRRELAAVYDGALAGTPVVPPGVGEGRSHTYHLYVVQTADRAAFRGRLAESGIGTAIHYPRPVHRQPAYTELDRRGGFPVAEALCERIVSLPLSETHTDEEIAAAADAAREWAIA
jgi:dTDP-4-amino-4,6-dideoxygalactose transaminase